jgi:AraC-like DNA-binding protein
MPTTPRREDADFHCIGEPGTLGVLRATFTRQRFAPHSHESYAIGAVERGVTVFERSGRRWVAPAGSVMLINPGDVHTGAAGHRAGWTYTMFYVGPMFLADALGGGHLPRFEQAVVGDARTAAELAELGAMVRANRSHLGALRDLLAEIAGAYGVPIEDGHARITPAIQAALTRIEADRGLGMSIHRMAKEVGLSVFHFIRAFRQATGLTPYAYIQQERLRLAQELMTEGGSLARIALLTGFADQSHFTRAFKRRLGMTPGVFMRGLPHVGGMAQSA